MATTWPRLLPSVGTAIGILASVASSLAQSTPPESLSVYNIAIKEGLCAASEHSSSVITRVEGAKSPSIAPSDLYAHLLSLAMCNKGAQYSALIRSTPPKDWRSAIAEWDHLTEEGIKKHPANCVALLFRADAQRRAGEVPHSNELLEKIKKMQECPRQVMACALMIEAHSLLTQEPADQSGQARDLLERAKELATESSAPLINLGFYYLAKEHFVRLRAKSYFEQALSEGRDPDNSLAKLGLAKAKGDIIAFNEAKEEIGIRTLIIILKWVAIGGVASANMESIDERTPLRQSLSIIEPEVTNVPNQ